MAVRPLTSRVGCDPRRLTPTLSLPGSLVEEGTNRGTLIPPPKPPQQNRHL